jgi:hypothetical protein
MLVCGWELAFTSDPRLTFPLHRGFQAFLDMASFKAVSRCRSLLEVISAMCRSRLSGATLALCQDAVGLLSSLQQAHRAAAI